MDSPSKDIQIIEKIHSWCISLYKAIAEQNSSKVSLVFNAFEIFSSHNSLELFSLPDPETLYFAILSKIPSKTKKATENFLLFYKLLYYADIRRNLNKLSIIAKVKKFIDFHENSSRMKKMILGKSEWEVPISAEWLFAETFIWYTEEWPFVQKSFEEFCAIYVKNGSDKMLKDIQQNLSKKNADTNNKICVCGENINENEISELKELMGETGDFKLTLNICEKIWTDKSENLATIFSQSEISEESKKHLVLGLKLYCLLLLNNGEFNEVVKKANLNKSTSYLKQSPRLQSFLYYSLGFAYFELKNFYMAAKIFSEFLLKFYLSQNSLQSSISEYCDKMKNLFLISHFFSRESLDLPLFLSLQLEKHFKSTFTIFSASNRSEYLKLFEQSLPFFPTRNSEKREILLRQFSCELDLRIKLVEMEFIVKEKCKKGENKVRDIIQRDFIEKRGNDKKSVEEWVEEYQKKFYVQSEGKVLNGRGKAMEISVVYPSKDRDDMDRDDMEICVVIENSRERGQILNGKLKKVLEAIN